MNDHDTDLTELVRRIRAHYVDAKVVVLALTASLDSLVEAIEVGISGYLTEKATPDALVKSLEVIMADGVVFPSASLAQLRALRVAPSPTDQVAAVASALLAADASVSPPGLSVREIGILRALVLGDSNKLIARKLQIAEATVKVHVKAILRKIRVRNRTQAAIWAMNNGVPAARSDANGMIGEIPPRPLPEMISLNA